MMHRLCVPVLGCALFLALAGLPFTPAAAQESTGELFDGVWTRTDGTVVLLVEHEGVLIGYIQTPSEAAAEIYGWSEGDLVFEALLTGATGTGGRHYRFPLEHAPFCPGARGATGAMDVSLGETGMLTTRWQNGLLQQDCRITRGEITVEIYERSIELAPNVVVPPANPALTSIDQLTADNFTTIAPECIELAADFLAQKAAYPHVKQRWLNLIAQLNALGGEEAIARMQTELRELERDLTPPPPQDPAVAQLYIESLRRGWRHHAAAVDAAANIYLPRTKNLIGYIFNIPTQTGWYDQVTYDSQTGERLTENDLAIIRGAEVARSVLERQKRKRQAFLVQRIAFAEELQKQITEAASSVDRLEQQVLATITALKQCLRPEQR